MTEIKTEEKRCACGSKRYANTKRCIVGCDDVADLLQGRAHFTHAMGATWRNSTSTLQILCNSRCPNVFDGPSWLKYFDCWSEAIKCDENHMFDIDMTKKCTDASRCPGLHIKQAEEAIDA